MPMNVGGANPYPNPQYQQTNPGGLLSSQQRTSGGMPGNAPGGGGGINPDGSSRPSATSPIGGGLLTTGSPGPMGGAMGQGGYQGIPLADLLAGSPTSLINNTLGNMGVNPNGGLGMAARGALTSDQLSTMYALAAASGGQIGGGAESYGNWIDQFYRAMLTGGNAPPTYAGLMGGAFQGAPGDQTNPFTAALTGGTPMQQVGQMLGSVQDISGLASPNPILARGIQMLLQNLAASYLNEYGKGNDSQFVNYIQQQNPMLANVFGG